MLSNSALSSGVFPSQLYISIILPSFKSNSLPTSSLIAVINALLRKYCSLLNFGLKFLAQYSSRL